MCGITGILAAESISNDYHFNKVLDLLKHRGPDARGTCEKFNRHCLLGHTRLSIQDLTEASVQPFEKNHLCLTFNGEIYNFIELREELISLGYQFETSGDTEVVIEAYREWGENCFNRFNGMWAMAIWDSRENQLILSRDRFGVKPLFYSFDERQLSFASELPCFGQLHELSPQLNIQHIENAFSLGTLNESNTSTLLHGVEKFPPGKLAKVSLDIADSKLKINWSSWWYFSQSIQPSSDFAQRKQMFAEKLENAMKLRLRSDAPLGISLSGGLDSGTIAVNLPKDREITAYTFDTLDENSELDAAKHIAKHAGIKHIVVAIESPNLEDILTSSVNHHDVCNTSHFGLSALYKKMHEDGIKVSIEGHGGDELLAGYKFHRPYSLQSRLHAQTNAFARIKQFEEFFNDFPDTDVSATKNLMISLRGDDLSNPNLLNEGLTGSLTKLTRSLDQNLLSNDMPPLRSRINLDFSLATLPAILRNFDHLAMQSGIEVRSPFLDWEMVEFCRSLPEHDLIHKGLSKWILRDSQIQLPASVRYDKRKKGFVSPFNKLIQRVPRNQWLLLSDYLHGEAHEYFLEQELPDKVMALNDPTPVTILNKTWGLLTACLVFNAIKQGVSPNALVRTILH